MYIKKMLFILSLLLTAYFSVEKGYAACGDGLLPGSGVAENPRTDATGFGGWLYCDLMLNEGDILELTYEHTEITAVFDLKMRLYYDTRGDKPVMAQDIVMTTGIKFEAPATGRYDIYHLDQTGVTRDIIIRGSITRNAAPPQSDGDEVFVPPKPDLTYNSSPVLFQRAAQLVSQMLAGRVRALTNQEIADNIDLFEGSGAGKSAGEAALPYSLWGDISATRLSGKDENDGFDGLVMSAVAGGDWQIMEDITVGAALGLSYGQTETGQDTQLVESDQTGVSLSPYLIWQMDDIFSLSAIGQVGYSRLQAENRVETIGQNAWQASAEIRGSAHLKYHQTYLLTELSLSYGMNYIGEGKTSLGQKIASDTRSHGDLSVRLQPGYVFDLGQGAQLESYITGTYRYGFVMNKQPLDLNNALRLEDRDDLRAGVGVRYKSGNIAAGLEATHLFLQDAYRDTRLRGTIEIKF